MPKKVIHHDYDDDTVEGFLWDGFRLSEFSRWYKGNFCYHAGTESLVIDSTTVNIGDWLVRENGSILILDKNEFEEQFDIAED